MNKFEVEIVGAQEPPESIMTWIGIGVLVAVGILFLGLATRI